MNAQVLGISTDPVPSIKAWAESLGGITYPLLSDFWPHGAVSTKYGVLRTDGTTERAIFVVDKFGFIRYANIYDIDKQPENEDIFNVLRRLEPQLAIRTIVSSEQTSAPLPHGGIVLYCTSWCPECRRARAWLKARDLEFTEVDIDSNPAAAIQVKKWANGTRTTPLFDIDGTIIIRFDESKLQGALKDRLHTV